MSHANATLTPRTRLRLARLIVEQGWTCSTAAKMFMVSPRTARKWADRYRLEGPAGMVDRSSRPHHSPTRTPEHLKRQIVALRWRHRLGPVQIGGRLKVPASTVHAVLTRCRINRLSHIDRVTGEPLRRYEHDHPGSLIHVDVTKFGNIPDGGGWRYVGRQQGEKNRSATVERTGAARSKWRGPLLGRAYLHTVIDDHSRVAYAEICIDIDIYARKELYSHVKTVVSYVVGTSRYPYTPEFIAGVWPWYLNPGDLSDEEFVTKAALMHGIRGFSRYMLVERDRWLDSPIRRDGRERADKVGVFGKVNTLLEEAEYIRFHREADVLLLANREYDRLEATSVLISFPGDFLETPSGFSEYAGALTISEDPLGFDQPVQLLKSTWFGAFSAGLAASGYGSVLPDTALKPERWAGRKVVVVSTLDYLDTTLQQSLVDFARAGGTVVMGPKAPTLDSAMQPCTVLADALVEVSTSAQGTQVAAVGKGRLVLVSSLDQVSAVLAEVGQTAGLVKVTVNDPALDVAVHGAADDATAKLVFVANPTAAAIDAKVEVGGRLGAVRELWYGRDVTTDGTAIVETLAPYSIHVYRCTVTA